MGLSEVIALPPLMSTPSPWVKQPGVLSVPELHPEKVTSVPAATSVEYPVVSFGVKVSEVEETVKVPLPPVMRSPLTEAKDG